MGRGQEKIRRREGKGRGQDRGQGIKGSFEIIQSLFINLYFICKKVNSIKVKNQIR
jgi:hypothetical protein